MLFQIKLFTIWMQNNRINCFNHIFIVFKVNTHKADFPQGYEQGFSLKNKFEIIFLYFVNLVANVGGFLCTIAASFLGFFFWSKNFNKAL